MIDERKSADVSMLMWMVRKLLGGQGHNLRHASGDHLNPGAMLSRPCLCGVCASMTNVIERWPVYLIETVLPELSCVRES